MFYQENTLLVVVDVQGKLAGLMYEKDKVYRRIVQLAQCFITLKIPIIATEQAPDKIGKTIPLIADQLKDVSLIKKQSFSCCQNEEFNKTVKDFNRNQIVIAGIETHVCIMQTVSDLLDKDFDVQVVYDAVSSRKALDKETAINRMRQLGADITSTEMIITELLKTANHPQFKDVMSQLK